MFNRFDWSQKVGRNCYVQWRRQNFFSGRAKPLPFHSHLPLSFPSVPSLRSRTLPFLPPSYPPLIFLSLYSPFVPSPLCPFLRSRTPDPLRSLGSAVNSPEGSGAELQKKSISVHFRLKI